METACYASIVYVNVYCPPLPVFGLPCPWCNVSSFCESGVSRPILFSYYTALPVCNFLVNGICFWDLSSHSPPLPLFPLHFLTSSPGRSSCLVFYSSIYFLTVACQIPLVFWLKIEFNLWLNILGNCFLEVINYITHDGNIYFHVLEH